MRKPRFSIRLLLLVTTFVALAFGFLPWFHDFSIEHALLAALAVQFVLEVGLWGYAHASRTFLMPPQSEESAESD